MKNDGTGRRTEGICIFDGIPILMSSKDPISHRITQTESWDRGRRIVTYWRRVATDQAEAWHYNEYQRCRTGARMPRGDPIKNLGSRRTIRRCHDHRRCPLLNYPSNESSERQATDRLRSCELKMRSEEMSRPQESEGDNTKPKQNDGNDKLKCSHESILY